MAVNAKCLEEIQIHPCYPAVVTDDADDDTMNTGDYISLKNYGKVLILFAYGDGTATTGDIDLLLYQATDVSGTDAKVLDALETGRIYEKTNASTLAAVGQWTKVTQATADEEYDDTDSGEEVGMIALEVRASDLDVTNNFDCIRVDSASITSTKLVCALYILMDPKYAAAPESMLSALAN